MSSNVARELQILVVDTDPALHGLLEEWLAEIGCGVVHERAAATLFPDHFDLVLVDLAVPRKNGTHVLKRIARERPGTPVLALSSTFFAGIECHGAVAQALGVASVLPKPLKRQALIDAVRDLLRT